MPRSPYYQSRRPRRKYPYPYGSYSRGSSTRDDDNNRRGNPFRRWCPGLFRPRNGEQRDLYPHSPPWAWILCIAVTGVATALLGTAAYAHGIIDRMWPERRIMFEVEFGLSGVLTLVTLGWTLHRLFSNPGNRISNNPVRWSAIVGGIILVEAIWPGIDIIIDVNKQNIGQDGDLLIAGLVMVGGGAALFLYLALQIRLDNRRAARAASEE